ncbi:Caleosin-domain-containing protein [Dacryopinax primogenitus]|uniref:Caleosin-domain-containing protein n=1 Tax=Dacryopinax primogenitus (strain DJM 731) TaxID=1858805 RepID=M5GCV3_DACPD|nr:Caleosin-domain-containing protein [Dacryopinax primogenitus]EJU04077.1 Caleosin-domain-containing protein [Dacryopinax primogenitus]
MSKSPKELNEVKGTQGQKSQTTGPQNQRTFLEKHCDFFDPDGDGQIWPMDTFFGFWVLGFSLPICLFSVFAIHFAFSWPTQHWFPIPDLFWRINIDRIGKHGSDSGAYDHDGGFDKNAFDRMFTRNAKTHKDLLTGRELLGLMLQNKVIYDPFGWFGGAFEWLSVYLLFWPRDNMFRQEDIRGLYDGSTFYEIAREQKKKGRYTPPGWEDTVSGFRK